MSDAPDGWMRLEAGETVLLDLADAEPGAQSLRDALFSIRGAILSNSLMIEMNIDRSITGYLFGKYDENDQKRSFFVDNIIRKMNIDRKIALLRKIAKPILSDMDFEIIFKSISDFQFLRNAMAHYPCWISPVKQNGSDLVVSTRLYIKKDDIIWELTEKQAEDWNKLTQFAINGAEQINDLINNPDRERKPQQPGSRYITVIGAFT